MTRETRKNAVLAIVLSFASLSSLTFIIYANIKANEAAENSIEAQRQTELAYQQRVRADELQQAAENVTAEAVLVKAEVDRIRKELVECQSK